MASISKMINAKGCTSGDNMQEQDNSAGGDNDEELTPLTIKVSDDLRRAYQRCTWILINETGKNQLDIMDEMVRDFLTKHGC